MQRSLSRESLRSDGTGEDRGRVRSQSPSGSSMPRRGPSLHAALQEARRELVLRDQELARAKELAVTERRGRKQQVAAVELRLEDLMQELVRTPETSPKAITRRICDTRACHNTTCEPFCRPAMIPP